MADGVALGCITVAAAAWDGEMVEPQAPAVPTGSSPWRRLAWRPRAAVGVTDAEPCDCAACEPLRATTGGAAGRRPEPTGAGARGAPDYASVAHCVARLAAHGLLCADAVLFGAPATGDRPPSRWARLRLWSVAGTLDDGADADADAAQHTGPPHRRPVADPLRAALLVVHRHLERTPQPPWTVGQPTMAELAMLVGSDAAVGPCGVLGCRSRECERAVAPHERVQCNVWTALQRVPSPPTWDGLGPYAPLLAAAESLLQVPLYAYQRRAVVRMLALEGHGGPAPAGPAPDPCDPQPPVDAASPGTGPSQGTMRGGLLCEDMGTGKTATCIVLVLAALGTMARVDEGDLRVLYNAAPPPSVDELASADAVRSSGMDGGHDGGDHPRCTVLLPRRRHVDLSATAPPLQSLCFLQLLRSGVATRSLLPHRLCEQLAASLATPFYRMLPRMTPRIRTLLLNHAAPGKGFDQIGYDVYLSAATLVIVPPHLMQQWASEMHKFVRNADGALRYLIIRSGDPVPPVDVLLQQDLVIASMTRLRMEPLSADAIGPMSAGQMQDTAISELARIHWLRIVIDEGHALGAVRTNQTLFAQSLRAERRWVCTGTLVPAAKAEQGLTRLQSLVSFLRVPAYGSTAFWRTAIELPWREDPSRALGRVQRLLDAIAVRTQPDDIQREVTLPPCHVRLVRLAFEWEETARYNVRVAEILANWVLTEGEGVDSYADPRNQRLAQSALTRLRQSCLLYATPEDDDARKFAVVNIRRYLEKNSGNPRKVAFCEQARQLLDVLESAAAVHATQASSLRAHGVGYFTDGLHVSLLRCLRPSADDDTDRAGEMRSAVLSFAELRMLEEIGSHAERLHIVADGVDRSQPVRPLPGWISRVQVRGTTSAKLTYLISRIRECVKTEKCIVFSSFNDVLYDVCEALVVANVRHIAFHTRMRPNERSQAAVTFNTSEAVRVIVMATELAAYGINLTGGSRIFFIDLVWEPSKEMQAIKRAYRIGQTRPVYVEKIVVGGTVEDDLLELGAGAADTTDVRLLWMPQRAPVRAAAVLERLRLLPPPPVPTDGAALRLSYSPGAVSPFRGPAMPDATSTDDVDIATDDRLSLAAPIGVPVPRTEFLAVPSVTGASVAELAPPTPPAACGKRVRFADDAPDPALSAARHCRSGAR